MTAEARAALVRCTELGCTPALVADAAAGAICPFDLARWVGQWAAERRAAGRCRCDRCGAPCGVLVARCRGCLVTEEQAQECSR